MEQFLMNFQAFVNSWWPFTIAFIITIITSIKIYFGGTYCLSKDQLNGKTVVITGATSGVGFETAKELSKRGGKLILAVRNLEKGRQTVGQIRKFVPNANLVLKLVDMSDFSSIRNFAQDLINDNLVIDVLINNAAVIFQKFQLTTDGHEKHIATNYYGPFLLTHLLLPLLKKSEDARVINVSSLAHFNAKLCLDDLNLQKSFNPAEAFAQSKLCLTMFTKHIAQYYKKNPLTFNAVSPGLVRDTNHMNQSLLSNNFMTKLSVMPWIWLFMKSPKQGCQSIVYLAVEKSLCRLSGHYFSECEVTEPAKTVNNQKLCTLLYEKTCKIVNIPFMPLPSAYEEPDEF